MNYFQYYPSETILGNHLTTYSLPSLGSASVFPGSHAAANVMGLTLQAVSARGHPDRAAARARTHTHTQTHTPHTQGVPAFPSALPHSFSSGSWQRRATPLLPEDLPSSQDPLPPPRALTQGQEPNLRPNPAHAHLCGLHF